MTIYYSFTRKDINYYVVGTLSKGDSFNYGDVYVPLEHESESFCLGIACKDCSLRGLCDSSDRLASLLKLAPNLLTNFPELGV